MKLIKSLLALSAIAAATGASAASVATFTYEDSSTVYGVVTTGRPPVVTGPSSTVYGANGATGSGILDDVANTLTLDISYWYQTAGAATHKFDATKTVVLTGTIDLVNYVFNATSSTTTVNSCVNTEANGCANVALGTTTSESDLSLSLLNPTVFTSDGKVEGQPAWMIGSTTYTPTLTQPPPVPIPAAAWLFGSGLLGLAGKARRRKA